MAYITKFGTLHGAEIKATGRFLFVAPSSPYIVDGRSYDASDDVNDGESPERALATVDRAVTLAGISRGGSAISNAKDTIVLLPGTHTLTSLLRIDTAGVTITGLPNTVSMENGYASQTDTILTASASQHLLSIEASNVTIGNLTLRPITGFIAVVFRNNPTVDNFRVKNVVIDMHTPAGSGNTGGIDFGYRANSSTALHGSWSTKGNAAAAVIATAYLENVTFLSRDSQGRALEQATACLTLKNVWFKHTGVGTWATPYMVATNSVTSVAENLRFTTSGTLTTNISAATAGSVTSTLVINKSLFSATTTTGSPVCYAAANVVRISEGFQPDRRHTLGFMVSVVSVTGDGL